SSRRRHTRFSRDWSSDVCSSDLIELYLMRAGQVSIIQGQFASARSYASRMLQINSRNGEAYLLHGDAIAGSSAQCDDGKLGTKRSEERRVGKEWQWRWRPHDQKK